MFNALFFIKYLRMQYMSSGKAATKIVSICKLESLAGILIGYSKTCLLFFKSDVGFYLVVIYIYTCIDICAFSYLPC